MTLSEATLRYIATDHAVKAKCHAQAALDSAEDGSEAFALLGQALGLLGRAVDVLDTEAQA